MPPSSSWNTSIQSRRRRSTPGTSPSRCGRKCRRRRAPSRSARSRPSGRPWRISTRASPRSSSSGATRSEIEVTVAAPALSTTAVPRRAVSFDSTWLIWIAIIAVLLFLVVSPFIYLVITSFTAEKTGDFNFAHYATAYGRARYVDPLMNSLKLGGAAAALAGLFAIPLAWAVARTDMPGRGLTRILVLATFITPPYTGAVAWILLAGPNAGWLNRFFMLVTGAEAGPFNIYSFTGLALVIALYSFPYIFIFTTAALELVSSELEDAATILGAGAWRTMRRVDRKSVV